MSAPSCVHALVVCGTDRPFSYSVSTPGKTDENKAAHGCIVYTEVCRTCGSRRSVAQNQRHYEYGAWGPNRAVRLAKAQSLRAEAQAIRETSMAVWASLHRGESTIVLRIDAEGYIFTTDLTALAADVKAATLVAPRVLDAACALRRAHLLAIEAAADVDG